MAWVMYAITVTFVGMFLGVDGGLGGGGGGG